MKVLIVGDSCGALASVRDLGPAGWIVGIGSSSRLGWAAASRWASNWHHVPPPFDDLEGFIRAINRVTEKHHYEVVFGAGDAEVLALSANRKRIAPLFPYAPHSCVMRGFDKLHLAEAARKAGLSTPITREASENALSDLGLPVVVKSRLHWNPDRPNNKSRLGVVIATNRNDALQQAHIMRSLGAEPLFQQYVPGGFLGLAVLTNEKHRIVAQHGYLATHIFGSESGPPAWLPSVPVDEDLAAKVQKLLIDIQWFGLTQLQFQLSDQGEAFLNDFNGRMYGPLALANACGMRAMDTWARLATGRRAIPSEVFVGPYLQALEGDLRWALAQPGARRFYAVWDCVVRSVGAIHPILSWSDPLPTLAYLVRLLRRAAVKAWDRAASH